MTEDRKFINSVLKRCDEYLLTKFGMGWNDLPDTVSVWDWVDPDTKVVPDGLIKDICWEKLADEYPDRCELNKIIYDECSCCLHDARQIEIELEEENDL